MLGGRPQHVRLTVGQIARRIPCCFRASSPGRTSGNMSKVRQASISRRCRFGVSSRPRLLQAYTRPSSVSAEIAVPSMRLRKRLHAAVSRARVARAASRVRETTANPDRGPLNRVPVIDVFTSVWLLSGGFARLGLPGSFSTDPPRAPQIMSIRRFIRRALVVCRRSPPCSWERRRNPPGPDRRRHNHHKPRSHRGP